MKEQPYVGNVSSLRKSEFIGADDDLDGYTKSNPLKLTVEKMILCNDVIDSDGQKENDVVAFAFKNAKRRLRLNAGRRKIMIKAHGAKAINWSGATVRLYRTVDVWAGQTVSAVGMDVQLPTGDWLIYMDFQTKRGRKVAEAFHSKDNS